jgi:dihydroflavonol-4-reductase
MTTFVTGATSSIGRVLVTRLVEQGEPVRVLVRASSNRSGLPSAGVEYVVGDVTDPAAVLAGMEGCERVTHLAAVVGGAVPESVWWQVNLEGTRHVLEACQTLGVVSCVLVSSLSVLGHTDPGELADETRPIDPTRHTNLYQKTKYAAQQLALNYAGRGLNVKIVYPGFGFGCSFASSHPSMQDQTLLRMASGQPCAIMGSGQNRLLVAYYADTSAAIDLAHQRGQSGGGYILGNENVTFPEIWQGIAHILSQPVPTRRIPLGLLRMLSAVSGAVFHREIFPADFFDMVGLNWNFSNRKAHAELGWQPLPFTAAMQQTWTAYQKSGWPSNKAK